MTARRIAELATLSLWCGLFVRLFTWDSPSLMWVSVFWACTIPSLLVHTYINNGERLQRGFILVGASLNAVVMLANGGAMPVVGMSAAYGVWVPWSHAGRFRFFVDGAVSSGGWSVGDLILLCGVVLVLSNNLRRRMNAEEVTSCQ